MAEKVMKVNVRDSTMVKPVEEMPRRALWLHSLVLVRTINHTPSVYFYKPDQNCRSNFFNPAVLKHALSKASCSSTPWLAVSSKTGAVWRSIAMQRACCLLWRRPPLLTLIT
ncbi:hypothetical protein ACFXTO_033454 [Malus domestica]